MQLADFFSQLNPQNLVIFFVVFIIFDAIGSNIAHLIKPPNYLRITYWIWGLAFFNFIWFLLHFLLPFRSPYVWLSLVIFGILSIPTYIRNKGMHTLFEAIIKYPYLLILLTLAIKPLYFLLSAPPYYGDEMIYHFYSPARLNLETSWVFLSSINTSFGPSLYEMIPKLLNMSYWLMFSLTKTYATARLLHFLIVFSSVYSVSVFLRKNTSLFVSILYTFLSLYLSAFFLQFSTLGYVDAGAAAFAILFLITIADLFITKKKSNLYASGVILGITIGMKYTILAFLFSVILISIVLAVFSYHKDIYSIIRKLLRRSLRRHYTFLYFNTLFLISIMGGYWYIKNFLMSGNPIYPFFFKCLHNWQCATGFNLFAGWAIPLDWKHYPQIKSIIFQGSNEFYYVTLISLILTIIGSRIVKKNRIYLTSLIITFSIITEIFLSKNISGFELRYYFHWVLLIPLILVLPFGLITGLKIHHNYFKQTLFIAYIFILLYAIGPVAKNNIKRLYEGDFVPGYVRNYSTNRISLNQWIDYYYPKMNNFIHWCGNKGTMKDVLVIDPGLIWTSNEEYMKVFMVNCNFITNVASNYSQPGELIKSIKNKHPDAFIASLERCDKNKSYKNINPDQYIVSRYEANQYVVCNSREILKNVYSLSD